MNDDDPNSTSVCVFVVAASKKYRRREEREDTRDGVGDTHTYIDNNRIMMIKRLR